MRRIVQRLRQSDDALRDRLLAGALVTGSVIEVVARGDLEGPLVLNLIAVIVMSGALLWRRSHPLACAVTVAAAALVLQFWLTSPPELGITVFALIFASFSCGVHAETRRAVAALVVICSAILTICLIETPDDVLFPFVIFGVLPWVLGRMLRSHTLLARELAEKEARARHLEQASHDRAIARERTRVARELHDVLAHNLSVMVIQAAGARRSLESDPAVSAEAVELIRTTGRDTLTELRHMFGPVRRGTGESLEGSPGLAHVESLVDRARTAGLDVDLSISPEPAPLGAGAESAAYRVIQEGLTNVFKHAGKVSARVDVNVRPGGVEVVVRNEAPGDSAGAHGAELDSGGQGLVGMRERVALYGGELEAGPLDDGGFEVRAWLPAEPAVAGVPA